MKIMKEADELSLFLRNRADSTGDLNDYDKEMLLDASRVMDELSNLAKRLSEEYLLICDEDCIGDDSVGIPQCSFYKWPDVDDDDRSCPGGCELKEKLE